MKKLPDPGIVLTAHTSTSASPTEAASARHQSAQEEKTQKNWKI